MDGTARVALVTGASRGLGRALALGLAGPGVHVCALARTQGALEELDDAVRAAGGRATLVPLDVTDDAGLERLGAALFERFGRLDLWVHAVAPAPALAPAGNAEARDLDRTLAVGPRATDRLIRVLDPLLRRGREPRAVLIGDRPRPPGTAPAPGGGVPAYHGLYAAAKAAQSALFAAWAAEAGGRVTVAEAIPPPMPTALRARFYPGEARAALARPEAVAAAILARLPELAPGERAEIAPVPPRA